MPAQFRLVSRMAYVVAFGLMVMMSGIKAHAQSVTLTSFSATGSPGGYYNVTDTVNLGIAISLPSSGGYGYEIFTDVQYYSGPNLSGTMLLSTTNSMYGYTTSLPSGSSNKSATLYFNTPAILRASEPAGTQSFLYVYHISGGAGCNSWNGTFAAYTTPYFIVHG